MNVLLVDHVKVLIFRKGKVVIDQAERIEGRRGTANTLSQFRAVDSAKHSFSFSQAKFGFQKVHKLQNNRLLS